MPTANSGRLFVEVSDRETVQIGKTHREEFEVDAIRRVDVSRSCRC